MKEKQKGKMDKRHPVLPVEVGGTHNTVRPAYRC
jgi:hypothetical protein